MKAQEILALMFTAELIAMIGVETLRKASALNSQDAENLDVCHTHDFCDANVAMFEAWHKLYPDREINFDEVNAAWKEARSAWAFL